MKTLLALALAFFLGTLGARAHVGSPDVFFEGKAGPHQIRVIVRPPRTLPGIAQVDVRVESAVTAEVSLRAAFGDADASWIAAAHSPANPQLHSAEVWLLRRGVYRLEVSITADGKRSEVIVPLNIAPTQQPQMPAPLGTVLVALGLLISGGAVWLVRKIARESTLARGSLPGPREKFRSRRAAVVATVVVLAAVATGAWRWRSMDRIFRETVLDQPVPVTAEMIPTGGFRLLRMSAASASANPGWDMLVTDHGKLVHLFLVREPAGDFFAHLHPVRRTARSFETLLPSLPAGNYALYGEITHLTGASQTLVARFALPEVSTSPPQAAPTALDEILCQSPSQPSGNAPSPALLDADAAWSSGAIPNATGNRAEISRTHGGEVIVFENANELVVNRDTTLRFSVFAPNGDRLSLRPYMGMAGHAVIRHVDGSVFAHLHPLGTISMAAQQLFTSRDSNAPLDPSPTPSAAPVEFPYAFPRAGDYLIWLQVRTATGVITGSFRIPVAADSSRLK